MTDTAELRALIADAITFHPGNRTGTPEQRHPVSVLLADAALRVVTPELERLAAERDGVYRERAQLLAFLAAVHESYLAYTDPDVPTWPVLIVESPAGQMCWHINPADLDLFDHVGWVDPVAIGWDGHTTEEKYERLRELTAMPSPQPDEGELVRCAALHCPNGERFHLLDVRGWKAAGWGTYTCPQHSTPEEADDGSHDPA